MPRKAKSLTTRQAIERLLAQPTEEELEQLYRARPVYRQLIGQLQRTLKAEREARRLNANSRWSTRTPEQRRAEMAAAIAASPRTKPGARDGERGNVSQ